MELVVIIEIVIERLEITDEEIEERAQHHINKREKDAEKSGVQPQETGSDADSVGSRKS